LAGGNFPADDQFRAAEKISLEIDEAEVTSLVKFVRRFQLFRQHLALWLQSAASSRPLLRSRGPDVDSNDVGVRDQRYPRIVGREVMERDAIARRFPPLTCRDPTVFGLHCFQSLCHRLARRLAVGRRSAVPATRAREARFLFSRRGFHNSYIGVIPLELQVRDITKLRDYPKSQAGWQRSCTSLELPTNFGNVRCGKLKALPPCALRRFMSNIKMFPNGHASRLAVSAKHDSGRKSLNIRTV
jgi:hypothetical protein